MKPHIYFQEGCWRIAKTKVPKESVKWLKLYIQAHEYVRKLNPKGST